MDSLVIFNLGLYLVGAVLAQERPWTKGFRQAQQITVFLVIAFCLLGSSDAESLGFLVAISFLPVTVVLVSTTIMQILIRPHPAYRAEKAFEDAQAGSQ